MKRFTQLLICIICLGIISCSPKVTSSLIKKYKPLDFTENVTVLGLEEEVPAEAELLGEIKIGDSGFTTKCTYEDVIAKAKLEAMKIGGNVLKITEHKTPSSMGSSCHRIMAKILKMNDLSKLKAAQEDEIISNADYAILNIYRYGGVGALIGYDFYLGNDMLVRVVNNFKTSIKVTKTGLNSVWAKTEAKDELPIDIEKGHQYYIRCSVRMGAFVGRPKLELVDRKTGKAEFESFQAKHQ